MTATFQAGKFSRPFRQLGTYLGESWAELRLVAWPTRSQTIQYTLIVTIAVLVVIAFTATLDYGLSAFFERILERRGLS